MTARRSTKLKILDAAEVLFAESGFADTSLRQITAKAEVNLASVNYHFGSKKELIQAVLDRYLSIFMPRLGEEFKALAEQKTQPSLQQVFSAFTRPLLELNGLRSRGLRCFCYSLDRVIPMLKGICVGIL